MKRPKSKTRFWITLATINILSVIYPINLIHGAKSVPQNFFAAFALIGVVFVLVVMDAVSLVIMDARSAERAASRYSSPADYEAWLRQREAHRDELSKREKDWPSKYSLTG